MISPLPCDEFETFLHSSTEVCGVCQEPGRLYEGTDDENNSVCCSFTLINHHDLLVLSRFISPTCLFAAASARKWSTPVATALIPSLLVLHSSLVPGGVTCAPSASKPLTLNVPCVTNQAGYCGAFPTLRSSPTEPGFTAFVPIGFLRHMSSQRTGSQAISLGECVMYLLPDTVW